LEINLGFIIQASLNHKAKLCLKNKTKQKREGGGGVGGKGGGGDKGEK
jgi:hypothetical protein